MFRSVIDVVLHVVCTHDHMRHTYNNNNNNNNSDIQQQRQPIASAQTHRHLPLPSSIATNSPQSLLRLISSSRLYGPPSTLQPPSLVSYLTTTIFAWLQPVLVHYRYRTFGVAECTVSRLHSLSAGGLHVIGVILKPTWVG
jgi:hypothetical protein